MLAILVLAPIYQQEAARKMHLLKSDRQLNSFLDAKLQSLVR